MTNYCLMQVKSIAECSPWSILQYFWPSLSYHLSLRSLFCLFLSGHSTQVLLYTNLLQLNDFICSPGTMKMRNVFIKMRPRLVKKNKNFERNNVNISYTFALCLQKRQFFWVPTTYFSVGKLKKFNYSITCVKQPLKNRQNKDFYDKW